MKQFNVNVLAKGQVVIPKELRDELEIKVGDSLSCFTRGSAIILKKKIQTTSYGSDLDGTKIPVGVNSDGKTLSLDIQEFKGITYFLGKAGFGKSVHALNLMYNMYLAGKSIIVFDPYGELISELKNYISDLSTQSIYNYTIDEKDNRAGFKKTIKNDKKQKIIAINTNFQGLGSKKSSELTKKIVLDCYKKFIDEETAIFIDEFGTYFDTKIRSSIQGHNGYTCLLDQGFEYLSIKQVKEIFHKVDNIAIYQVGGITAKYLVNIVGLSNTVQDLRNIEKYHFYFHSGKGSYNAGKLLLGIYPIS